MFTDDNISRYLPQLTKIFSSNPTISDIKPSEWAEKNIIIPGGKGRLSYDFNPYCREIVDCMAPDHPMRKGAVMKGSQITFSSGVLMPALGYTIKEDPHNTLFMVGDSKLIGPANEKLDLMIDGANLRDLISDQSKRKRKTKTGDTDEFKYFPGGYIRLDALTNPMAIAQMDPERIYLDDFDAMKGSDKRTGAFLDLVEMRGAANYYTFKLLMISTPLIKAESNIEPAFLAGDQRYFNIECPHCHKPITWKFKHDETIHFVWKEDNHGRLKEGSVEYICPKCGDAHNDKNKQRQLQGGIWVPTATAITKDYYSWHISSLYAPVSMNPWSFYVGKWLEAHPKGRPRNEFKYQTLVNTGFGLTYEPVAEAPKATAIMVNKQPYDIGIIPESLSIAHGNGKIVLLTCGSDMNGKMRGDFGKYSSSENDARLDWYVVAHTESGATYGIAHGSIGTFKPLGGNEEEDRPDSGINRVKWTYEHNKENSVWPEFDKILKQQWPVDTGGTMQINITALDCGAYATAGAYPFLDKSNSPIIGVKGDKVDQWQVFDRNVKMFRKSAERPDLYWVQGGMIKDKISDYMGLTWDGPPHTQPDNFMNFPLSKDGLFEYNGFFEHFESEARTQVTKDGKTEYRWQKKKSDSQNHLWDCFVYNLAARDIFVWGMEGKYGEREIKFLTWREFSAMAAQSI